MGAEQKREKFFCSHKNLATCTLIVRLHKYIICFDLDMYFLIDSNMSTIVITINKCIQLVMFYYFAVINCKYYNLLKSYSYLKLTAFYCFVTYYFIYSI